MNSIKEIAAKLRESNNVLLFPHVGIDGDGLGSCVALCKTLRLLGKNCYILYSEDHPSNLKFLFDGEEYLTADKDIISDSDLDIAMCVDCGDYQRFPDFVDKFKNAPYTICLDHHGTSKGIADMNLIDPMVSAAGELMYDLVCELGIGKELGKDLTVANAIYTAITTDTGNFQYSNTTSKCHMIAAELISWGVKINEIFVQIYENERLEKIEINNLCLSRMEIFADGKAAITYATYDELTKLGIEAGETEPIVQKLRSIAGVEISAFLKEKEPNTIRVSLRAKTTGNVAEIAKKHDGGGHVKAAGLSLYMTMEEAVEVIKKDILEAL